MPDAIRPLLKEVAVGESLKGSWYQFQVPMKGGVSPIPPHTKQFSDTHWVSENSSQFWHCLPGDSIRFQRLRTQSYKIAFHSLVEMGPRRYWGFFQVTTDWRFQQPSF